jgi:hypothetical protein
MEHYSIFQFLYPMPTWNYSELVPPSNFRGMEFIEAWNDNPWATV